MSVLNRGRKLFYIVGVALLGDRIVIKGNFGHAKSHLPYRRIDKLKMTTAMLDRFFGYWPLALAALQQSWESERLSVLVLV